MSAGELGTIRAIADVLVPRTESHPAATDDPDFDSHLQRALNARVDVFEAISQVVAELDGADGPDLRGRLQELSETNFEVFQGLSTVIAGAWLISPSVRERIGYPGQRATPAAVDLGTNEISSGILDPVIERGPIFRPTPR